MPTRRSTWRRCPWNGPARWALALLGLGCAVAAGALETARALAQAGAPRLALERLERLEPRAAPAAAGAQREILRLELLLALGRNAEAAARAAALAPQLPERERAAAFALGARAALAGGRAAQARALAARALWEAAPAAEAVRALRLLVIESHLSARDGATAFRAMLRFAQDHAPLEPAVAARFVEGLLDLDLGSEAATWLGALEEGSAARDRLLLRAGLLAPAAAVKRVRARAARGAERGHWVLLAEAGARAGDRALRLEAAERLLELEREASAAAARAKALREAYHEAAVEAANAARLLTGDDGAWYDLGARRAAAEPPLARALFAYLAERATSPVTRASAQLQLVVSLEQDGLGAVALRLFEALPEGAAALDPGVRRALGAIAAERGEEALAARLWEGLGAPPGGAEDAWQMRLALVHWRAGNRERALQALHAAAHAARAPSTEALERALVLAEEFALSGAPAEAGAALEALLPALDTPRRHELLVALARAAEAEGRPAAAADYYLRAALAAEGAAPERAALEARLAAGRALARAGYWDDARAQLEWVLRHARERSQIEAARRALERAR